MYFNNKHHQAVFIDTAKKINKHDKTKMSVLYLLTADGKLWNASKRSIRDGKIFLEEIKLQKSSVKGYTLLCCAKDISSGTNYLTVADLADTEIISPKLLGIIDNAIDIRRNGIDLNKFMKEKV